MKNIFKNPLFYLCVVLIVIVSFMVIDFVKADWGEPSRSFPEGNPAMPLDQSNISQTKNGDLNITGSLTSNSLETNKLSFDDVSSQICLFNGIDVEECKQPKWSNFGDGVTSVWDKNGSGEAYFMNNVGINNSNPNYKLDINGDLNVAGDIYQNGELLNSDEGGSSVARAFCPRYMPDGDGDGKKGLLSYSVSSDTYNSFIDNDGFEVKEETSGSEYFMWDKCEELSDGRIVFTNPRLGNHRGDSCFERSKQFSPYSGFMIASGINCPSVNDSDDVYGIKTLGSPDSGDSFCQEFGLVKKAGYIPDNNSTSGLVSYHGIWKIGLSGPYYSKIYCGLE